MATGLCVLVGGSPQITTAKDALEVGFAEFLKDFGQNCSIVGSLSSAIESDLAKAKKLKQDIEDTLTGIADVASAILKTVEDIIAKFPSLLQEGIDLLVKAIDEATGLITAAKDIMEDITTALRDSVDAAMMGLCETLSDAVSNAPTSIKELNASTTIFGPALEFAKKEAEKQANNLLAKASVKPTDILKGALEASGVRDVISTANSLKAKLNSVTDLRNIRNFAC